VLLITRRVLTALLRRDFLDKAVRPPTAEEKEEAKQWVEDHSCYAWRNGWLFVDGTLIPLYFRPFWYAEAYFDRKSNYSLNIQIISLPNLRIVDFSYGFTGSTHDATAWLETKVVKDHEAIFEPGEFIWADSAYPIQTWVVAPYKKPLRDRPENQVFNNHLSILRIRSEHAIGFLKGRFQSLKSLRLNIKDEATHKFATYWVAACIAVHSFAMQCEADEKESDDDEDGQAWDFIREGLSESDSHQDEQPMPDLLNGGDRRLAAGKQWREKLKASLFKAKERTRVQRQRARRRLHLASSSSSNESE